MRARSLVIATSAAALIALAIVAVPDVVRTAGDGAGRGRAQQAASAEVERSVALRASAPAPSAGEAISVEARDAGERSARQAAVVSWRIHVDGAPLAGAVVTLHRELTSQPGASALDASWRAVESHAGEARAFASDANGLVALDPSAASGATVALVTHPGARARWIELDPTGLAPLDAALEAVPVRYARVSLPGGAPAIGAVVVESSTRAFEPPVRRSALTDAAGHAALHGVPDGWIGARHGATVAPSVAVGGDATVELRLGAAFVARGEVHGASGGAADGASNVASDVASASRARVVARAWLASGAWQELASTAVGEDARYELAVPLVASDAYVLRLEHPAWVPEQLDVAVPAAGALTQDFVARSAATLTAAVHDATSGDPLPGARVAAFWLEGEHHVGSATVTDRDGLAHMRVPPGAELLVEARASGRALLPHVSTLAPAAGEPALVSFSLPRAAVLELSALRGGERVAASVHALGAGEAEPRELALEAGAPTRVDELAPGTWHLWAEADGERSSVHTVRLSADAPQVLELALARPVTVRGRVVAEDGEGAVAGASVALALALDGEPVVVASASTDERGAFLLTGAPEGATWLTVAHADAPPLTRRLAADGGAVLDLGEVVLARGAAVEVELAEPVAATLAFDGAGPLTLVDGRASFAAQRGVHTLDVAFDDGAVERRQVRVEDASARVRVPIGAAEGLVVRVADALVRDAGEGACVWIDFVDSEGRAVRRLEPLEGTARTARAIDARTASVALVGGDGAVRARSTVALVEHGRQEIALEVPAGRLVLVAVDAHGRRVPFARFALAGGSVGTGRALEVPAVADADGRAELALEAGAEFDVVASDAVAGLGRARGTVRASGATEVEIELSAGGSLEVRLVDGDEPLAGRTVRASFAEGGEFARASTDGAGRATFAPLHPGAFVVEAVDGDLVGAPERVEVAFAGTGVVLAVRRRGALRLLVRDGAGPLAGATVELHALDQTWAGGDAVSGWMEAGVVPSATLRTDADGTLLLHGLPRGRYRVVAVEGGARGEAIAIVAAGGVSAATVTVERATPP